MKRGSFGWIDQWTAEESQEGLPVAMSITVSEWLYEGNNRGRRDPEHHEDYFLLSGGIERWLYRVARKHGGKQDNGYRSPMRQLYEKSGSAARMTDFAIDIRKIVKADKLPEYALSLSRTMKDWRSSRWSPQRPPRQRRTLRAAAQSAAAGGTGDTPAGYRFSGAGRCATQGGQAPGLSRQDCQEPVNSPFMAMGGRFPAAGTCGCWCFSGAAAPFIRRRVYRLLGAEMPFIRRAVTYASP
jgi:hypothetical protein